MGSVLLVAAVVVAATVVWMESSAIFLVLAFVWLALGGWAILRPARGVDP